MSIVGVTQSMLTNLWDIDKDANTGTSLPKKKRNKTYFSKEMIKENLIENWKRNKRDCCLMLKGNRIHVVHSVTGIDARVLNAFFPTLIQ